MELECYMASGLLSNNLDTGSQMASQCPLMDSQGSRYFLPPQSSERSNSAEHRNVTLKRGAPTVSCGGRQALFTSTQGRVIHILKRTMRSKLVNRLQPTCGTYKELFTTDLCLLRHLDDSRATARLSDQEQRLEAQDLDQEDRLGVDRVETAADRYDAPS